MKTNLSKRIINYFVFTVLAILFTGCGAGKMQSSWTKDDYSDRSFSKVAVVGIGKNLKARNTFEQDAVQLLKENGINAVEGITLFPPGGTKEIRKAADYIKIIKENQLDGVLTMALVDSNEKERYQPGETVNVPSYYRVGRYIYRGYRTYSSPGYYTNEKSYLIEAVLYNVKGELFEGKETMVWTGQSSLLDPSSLESASQTFTKRMVNQIIADGIIIPK